jgi:large subunit ribosomal protein L23
MIANKIILGHILTEKSTTQKEKENKYFFKVNAKSNKIEIKKAIENLYKVNVKDVNTCVTLGKNRRVGAHMGKLSDWKKAIVTLKKGDSIKIEQEA